jgi:hypothetical protein
MNFLSPLQEIVIQPNIIDIQTDELMFLGYANNSDLTKCAIVRIEKEGNIYRFLCPENGEFSFNRNWDERENYNYKLRRF